MRKHWPMIFLLILSVLLLASTGLYGQELKLKRVYRERFAPANRDTLAWFGNDEGTLLVLAYSIVIADSYEHEDWEVRVFDLQEKKDIARRQFQYVDDESCHKYGPTIYMAGTEDVRRLVLWFCGRTQVVDIPTLESSDIGEFDETEVLHISPAGNYIFKKANGFTHVTPWGIWEGSGLIAGGEDWVGGPGPVGFVEKLDSSKAPCKIEVGALKERETAVEVEVRFSPDDRLLFVRAGYVKRVAIFRNEWRVYDTIDCALLSSHLSGEYHAGPTLFPYFAGQDCKWLASVALDPNKLLEIDLWNWRTGNIEKSLRSSDSINGVLDVSSDGRWIVGIGGGGPEAGLFFRDFVVLNTETGKTIYKSPRQSSLRWRMKYGKLYKNSPRMRMTPDSLGDVRFSFDKKRLLHVTTNKIFVYSVTVKN